jgi:phospholipase/lecithinase/hemolysin
MTTRAVKLPKKLFKCAPTHRAALALQVKFNYTHEEASSHSQPYGRKLMKRKTNIIRAAILASMLSLVSACGGGSGDGQSNNSSGVQANTKFQIVSFGDSLSDVGTYAPIASAVGGGRFTTNPGQVWVQDVAQYYGGTITAAYTIDFTQKLTAQGGLGYAEGGATVATPSSTSDFLVDLIGNVEMPVNAQVASYLQAHGSFNTNQLVLVWAGANDVLRAGSLPGAAATVQTAATTLAQVIAQIVQGGATHVAVANLPNIGLTPKGLAMADGGATLNQLSQLFNSTLEAALQTNGLTSKVILLDTYTWLNQIFANYQANGFTVSNTATACNPNTTPDDTALMCSPLTYAAPNADQTYMFADDLHITTRMHTLLAQYAEQQIANSSLGQ